MLDLLYIGGGLLFFALTWWMACGVERLRSDRSRTAEPREADR